LCGFGELIASVVIVMQLYRSTIPTPLGDMLALASDEGLCALEFTDPNRGQERLTRLNARLVRWFPPHQVVDRDTATIARTRDWLAAYFAGTAAEVGNLPLDMRGAPFEKRVWTALRTIPPGQTTSYGAIAQALGRTGASRAVGAACHRVIGSSGSLTGYGGGLDRKTWLIEHERRWRREPQASLF